MINRAALKAQAQNFIRTGAVSPLLVSAVILLITVVLDNISLWFEYNTTLLTELQRAWEMGQYYTGPTVPEDPSLAATFVPILIMLVTTLINTGFSSYCMGIRRGERTGFSALLDGLGVAGKVIWCDIQVTGRIMLWSMLFVIPGFIALYRYRFAMYNILRDPSLSASDAIALSCRQTEGMKLELFRLDLSFLGWQLAAAMTFGLLDVWVLPYTRLADLGYYEEALHRTETQQEPPHNFSL